MTSTKKLYDKAAAVLGTTEGVARLQDKRRPRAPRKIIKDEDALILALVKTISNQGD